MIIYKARHRIAAALVWLANRLVSVPDLPYQAQYYRPIDTHMPGIGHEFACGAYSYEGLKSLVEQDGPDGFGTHATIKWLIGVEGWQKVKDMEPRELRRLLAMSGVDIDGDLPGENDEPV